MPIGGVDRCAQRFRRGGSATVLRACVFLLSVLLPLAGAAGPVAAASPQEGATPRGEPHVARQLRDPDFGVTTGHPGLQRHVEMYQWTRDGSGYALAWRGARVDSSGFAPGHANPRDIPLREREWRADVTVDGRPVPRDVVDALGQWRPFRPGFTALPGNMAATFQPEGDGLGSAENPLSPQLGDLRITWRALVLPPLAGRLELRGGKWTLRASQAAAPVVDPGVDPPPPRDTGREHPRWPFVVVPVLALLALVAVLRRRRGSHE